MHTRPNHTSAAASHKTPTPGHPISLQRPVCALLPLASAVAALRKGTKLGEDAHQQLLATLHAELAIDAPQICVHGMRRQPEPGGGVFFRIGVEHGPHDAAFARREAKTA